MWLIAGTVPETDFPLCAGAEINSACLKEDRMLLPGGRSAPIARGTAALVAAAAIACGILGAAPPRVLLAGDQGSGEGSRKAYAWLAENLADLGAHGGLKGITFHYFYPDLDWHNRVLMAIEALERRPLLAADAGWMYAAKMSGYAASYDLFTPDAGELAFLADEKAPHPFYTRGFLSAGAEDAPGLLARAAAHGNRPANMIIKGKSDYIVSDGAISARLDEPSVPAMECIGGTGDIVTGLATAYLAAGYSIRQSAVRAAKASRYLAAFCNPDPSWQAARLIDNIRPMFEKYGKDIESEGF